MMLLSGLGVPQVIPLGASRTECCWHCSCESNPCCDGRSGASRVFSSVMRKVSSPRTTAQALRGAGQPFPWAMILVATGILGVTALALRRR